MDDKILLPCYLLSLLKLEFQFLLFQALGCMLYEMCTLQYAFEAMSLLSLYFKIVKGEFEVNE